MSEQPESLRLADALTKYLGGNTATQAAAELRRLHAVNAELLGALKQYGVHHGNCDYMILLTSLPPMRKPCSCGLHAAIEAALKERNNG